MPRTSLEYTSGCFPGSGSEIRVDFALETWDAYGTPINLNSGLNWNTGGTPDSFAAGGTLAMWDDAATGRWHALRNGGATAVAFPHTPNPTVAGSISRQKLTVTDFTSLSTTSFLLSFDGGLPVNALRVPEPSRVALLALGLDSTILGRRRR